MELRYASPATSLIRDQDADVTVWLVSTAGLDANTRLACLALLSDGERQDLARMGAAGARLDRLAGRALLRRTLSLLTDVAPETWSFTTTAYGQPVIAAPAIGRDLRFSLAHSDGLLALAVAEGLAVGIDAEPEGRAVEALAVAHATFAPGEAADLERLPSGARRGRFFDLWTLKEAYAKARGLGVHLPFDRFRFTLDDERQSIAFAAEPGQCRDWSFLVAQAGQRHRIAVAAETARMTVRARWTTLPEGA